MCQSATYLELSYISTECDVQCPILSLLWQPGLVHGEFANISHIPRVGFLYTNCRVTFLSIGKLRWFKITQIFHMILFSSSLVCYRTQQTQKLQIEKDLKKWNWNLLRKLMSFVFNGWLLWSFILVLPQLNNKLVLSTGWAASWWLVPVFLSLSTPHWTEEPAGWQGKCNNWCIRIENGEKVQYVFVPRTNQKEYSIEELQF